MANKVHKKDVELALKKADVLEVVVERIDRHSARSSKKLLASKFLREADKMINEERDILLIAVKLK